MFISKQSVMALSLKRCGAIAIALTGFTGCRADLPTASSPSPTPTPTITTAPATSQPPNPQTAHTMEPNLWFAVAAESGNCPDTIGLWEFMLAFEGGADHTVVPDLAAIAVQPVEIIRAEERYVAFTAPLKAEYATCNGTARSDDFVMYRFQLGNGQVRFELDLTNSDGLRAIRYADIAVNRPYVYWRAAE